ncbi:MAG: hypothetical protein ACRDBH_01460 [Bosea sp. (in: a-proteobacteria)]
MLASRMAAAVWQVFGVRIGAQREVLDGVEVFHGVGVAAIPAADGRPEAIVVNVGDARLPVIVATRDEKTRALVVPSSMAAGDTCIYSAGAIVYVRADGTVEVRSPDGVAKKLALHDELVSLRSYVLTHIHAVTGGATGAPTTLPLPAVPVGTQVLKGE